MTKIFDHFIIHFLWQNITIRHRIEASAQRTHNMDFGLWFDELCTNKEKEEARQR